MLLNSHQLGYFNPIMADLFAQEVLSRQYKFLTAQLDQLCDQYDSWKVRHDRAAQQHQKVFQYSLNLL